MKILTCPLNGPRNINEFICHGEVHPLPDPEAATDAEWAGHVWHAADTAGVVRE